MLPEKERAYFTNVFSAAIGIVACLFLILFMAFGFLSESTGLTLILIIVILFVAFAKEAQTRLMNFVKRVFLRDRNEKK